MRQLLVVVALVAVLFAFLARTPSGQEVWRHGERTFYRDGDKVVVCLGDTWVGVGRWAEQAGTITMTFAGGTLTAQRVHGQLAYSETSAQAVLKE